MEVEMNCYRNLLKRKKYGILIVGLICFIAGLCLAIWSFFRYPNFNIQRFHDIKPINFGGLLFAILFSFNMGLLLLGFGFMYLGLFFFPLSSPYSQDDMNYDVKIDNDYVYVKYQENNFAIKREDFSPKSFAVDKNNNHIPYYKKCRIYNYVWKNYRTQIIKNDEKSNR